MQQESYTRIVSIQLALQSRWEELHSSRELLQQWPMIEKLPDKTAKVEAVLEWEGRVREHLVQLQQLLAPRG